MLELKDKISAEYDMVRTHVPFSISRKSNGEIDLVARRGDRVDIYEVKCSHRIAKARKQVKRARKHIGKFGESYFYCGLSGVLVRL